MKKTIYAIVILACSIISCSQGNNTEEKRKIKENGLKFKEYLSKIDNSELLENEFFNIIPKLNEYILNQSDFAVVYLINSSC